MASSRPAKPFDWRNLAVRLLSALVLAPAALASAWYGGGAFLTVIGVAAALIAVEWGMMTAPRTSVRMAAVIALAVVSALCLAYSGWWKTAFIVVVAGMVLASLVARMLGGRTRDAWLGVAYIALPCLALLWLRGAPDDEAGRVWTMMVLAVAWAADSAAFLVGSVLRGPKLWPALSPNKTWTGFIGGLAAGMGAAVLVTELTGLIQDSWKSALGGFLCALATMGGDLFESMLKRRFGVKDSGDLIPGHGGLLDRIDGLMMAVLAMAAFRLALRAGVFS